MVAVTWTPQSGQPDVSVRVRTRYDGSWSGWAELAVDGDGPAPAEDSEVRSGTAPLWVKHATGVEVAVYADRSSLGKLEVDTIDPGSQPSAGSRLGSSLPDRTARSGGSRAGTFPEMPRIVTRRQWGADESLGDTCWSPRYGSTFKAVVVHHTAGSNDYSRSEGPAVVRGIYAYHTLSRGWCDIGYNFLIDRFGTVYQGRAGGNRLPVRGAHAGDYNVNTTGVSVMGNFDTTRPTRPTKHALVNIIAWRLGTAYHGAYGKVFLYDAKFRRISGHRDVMETACPGRYVYAWLPTLRQRVDNRLGGYESRIERAWRADGGAHGRLGPVRVGERGENRGRHTAFGGGRMYASKEGRYTLYHGPVLHRYTVAGETSGMLGYPASNVRRSARDGLSARFAGGRVYFSRATGSRILRSGAVLERYLGTGGAAGRLGFPVTPVYDTTGGSRAGFQSGYIEYNRATHKTTVTRR